MEQKDGGRHPFGANALGDIMNHGGSLSGKEKHCVFLNTGNDARAEKKFACVSAVSGLNLPDDGRGVIVTDWDGDGDQDLWISNRNAPRIRYLRNNSDTTNNFIALQPVGNGKNTNRDARASDTQCGRDISSIWISVAPLGNLAITYVLRISNDCTGRYATPHINLNFPL